MPISNTDPLYRGIDYALRLREAIERGETRDLQREQAALTNFALGVPAGDAAGPCRGARYAFVCWVDELFTCQSRWSDAWNRQKLESNLYGANDRASEFWRQAKLADALPTDETLAAYFLCVALGFRGELRHEPQALLAWVEKTRSRVARGEAAPGASSRSTRRPQRARRLPGSVRAQRFVTVATVATTCLLPLAAFAVVRRFLG
ncbi:hypothetical protein Pla108_19320 [Botrimarina colliarenosi]|uniref:Type IV / VI secretion system DotU domain-containing protein n=1 Tax=Botrimarina colliarenosi TaxID=2528001 RepID=A0A5C6AED1_9BACT|nr:DotU family type IV/VI secretion system protein [Botrimarina colliarenosi]TWT97780.1 hypothetical protein Pla108_19320 [Botrimarina colliarenosi]